MGEGGGDEMIMQDRDRNSKVLFLIDYFFLLKLSVLQIYLNWFFKKA